MSRRLSPRHCRVLVILLCAAAPLATPAAVPIEALHTVEVEGSAHLPADAGTFVRAFDALLVKVTGQRDLVFEPPTDPRDLVRQYQPLADGRVRVQFDPLLVGRLLDQADIAVWGVDRPLVEVRLPVAGPAGLSAQWVVQVRATAAARGLPVVLAEDGPDGLAGLPAGVPATVAVPAASLLLVAEPLATAGEAMFRWTLHDGDRRQQWSGDAAEGIHRVADGLAARDAVAASAIHELPLTISGLRDFDDYARLQAYLRRIPMIDVLVLEQASADRCVYRLRIRGGATRLREVLEAGPLLTATVGEAQPSGLHFRLAGSP